MDESTSALDVELEANIMRKLLNSGITLIRCAFLSLLPSFAPPHPSHPPHPHRPRLRHTHPLTQHIIIYH